MIRILLICLTLTVIINQNLLSQGNTTGTLNKPGEKKSGEKKEKLNTFTGFIYYLEKNILRLPDFKKLKPVGEIYTNSINIQDRDYQRGFPGVNNRFESFGIDYKGDFYIKDSTEYCFTLGSDDGSKLFIDEKLVISNDYQHKLIFKSNCIKLSKGFHKIEVQYYQGPRYNIALILKYRKSEDKVFQVFDISKLYPIKVNENDNSIDISIEDDILFEFNSFELNENAQHAIEEIKRSIIDKIKIKSISIEGHTDDIGSEEYNMKLSINRAKSVKEYLTSISVRPELIVTKGSGKMKPKVPNINDESRKKNRRVEMFLIKSDK